VLAQRVWDSISGWSVGQYIIMGLCALIVLVVMAMIAAQLTILIVGSYVILNAGVVMMGFLGSHWTRDHAINYFTTVLGMSVQIFIMQIVVIIGNDVFLALIDRGTDGLADYLMMVVMVIIYYALVSTVPNMASSLTTGRFSFDTGKAVGSAAAAAGATAGLGLAAASVMKAGGGGIGQSLMGSQMGQKALSSLSPNMKTAGAVAGKVAGG
ncbi:P-type conjugative transfer protein TrbL, partial [uncultured Vibrio sp.]